MEKMLGVPLQPAVSSHQDRRRSSHRKSVAPLSPLIDDEVAGAWGKAMKLNTRAKDKNVATNLKLPDGTKSHDARRKSGAGGLWGAHEELTEGERLMAKKEEVMDDWEREMNKTAQKAKIKSRAVVQKVKLGPDRRYPASWARFPSHDRDERMSRAGASDGVEQRDFAVQSKKDGKTIWYHSEKKHHLYHHEGDDYESHKNPVKKGFFGRLEERLKMKDKLSKFESDDDEDVQDQTFGRRGSRVLAHQLEYPELEILPMEVMSHAQIEQHVEEELEEDELQRKEDELDAIFGVTKRKAPEHEPEAVVEKATEEIKSKRRSKKRDQTQTDRMEMDEIRPSRKKLSDESEDKADGRRGMSRKSTERLDGDPRKRRNPAGKIDVRIRNQSIEEEVEAKLTIVRTATERPPARSSPKAKHVEETVGTAGMNASALDSQIAARLALKKKMEDAQKSGVRRGPRAKAKPAEISRPMPIVAVTAPEEAATVSNETAKTVMDGSIDNDYQTVYHSDGSDMEYSEISISHAHYYDDCIVTSIPTRDKPLNHEGDSSDETTDMEEVKYGGKAKFRTWSGKDWEGYRAVGGYGGVERGGVGAREPKRSLSFGCMSLRKSTDDILGELEKMERLERERVMRAAEEAWGK